MSQNNRFNWASDLGRLISTLRTVLNLRSNFKRFDKARLATARSGKKGITFAHEKQV